MDYSNVSLGIVCPMANERQSAKEFIKQVLDKCIDFKSVETIYQSAPLKFANNYDYGCLTYADGMLYLYSDNGHMALVKPANKGFEVNGKLKIEDPGERPTWAHPVVCGGRLYIRYGDKLSAYNVTARAKS